MEALVPTLSAYLSEPIAVGDPDVAGPLAFFPLFGPTAEFPYQSFSQGAAHGVTIKELAGGASINDLVVHNPTDLPVLLFEGEEVLGAQQNRTFDTSVLVPARSTFEVAVSCVEAGRWDGRRHSEAFEPAPQAAYPSLRRLKNRAVLASVVSGAEARADQGAVWEEVDHKLDALAASAPTRAIHDGYEHRRRDLDELTAACDLKPGQTGMVVAIGGDFAVLDRVSRPDVFASLFGPLVQGYALDALSAPDAEPPSRDDAERFVERVQAHGIHEHDAVGLGRDVRLIDAELTGAGLVHSGELVQLSVFVGNAAGDGRARRVSRINRPSRRRR